MTCGTMQTNGQSPRTEVLELDRTGLKTEDLIMLRRHTIAMLRWIEAELIYRGRLKPAAS